ncbi:Alpha/Beta hydrolase protein [Chaetomium fimeti]|uniref:Alpha/Beta hydrolase protein n=1 Tax=Chaetomium fimeti TaxID=1854472 RepID=A0AAE0HJA2_9PEZI|nr:Alpha/Beta hydrolase protein [Chaetomium fimeti]
MIGLRPSASAFRQAYSGCTGRVRVPVSASGPASGRFLAARVQVSAPFSTVSLAYDLHEPAKPVADKQTSPIIFMHGLFGSKKNNRTISKVLARDLRRHVYAVDLRNHGDSPHDHRHDYPAMAADVADFIRQHGLKEPTLIGHSMPAHSNHPPKTRGAKTAMALALHEPDLVANLIAVDNAPVDARLGSDFGWYIQGMKKIDEAGVTRQAEADEILAPYESSVAIRQFLLGNLHRPSAASKTQQFRVPLPILARALDHLGDFPFKSPAEVRFAKPALFVRGTQSKYVPDEVIPLIGQFFPMFELVDVDAGHWVISEKPEAFREAVIRFLEPKE